MTEKFQLASAATKKDRRWLSVHAILAGKIKISDQRSLVEHLDGQVDEDTIHERISTVQKIAEYEYHVETVRNMPYREVTDIFVRVNSRGEEPHSQRPRVATLTAQYPGFYDKLADKAGANRDLGYPSLGVSTLVRGLAVFGTPAGTLEGLANTSPESIDTGWNMVTRGIDRPHPATEGEPGPQQRFPASVDERALSR